MQEGASFWLLTPVFPGTTWYRLRLIPHYSSIKSLSRPSELSLTTGVGERFYFEQGPLAKRPLAVGPLTAACDREMLLWPPV